MQDAPRTYRIKQLGRPDAAGVQRNEAVSSLDGLVTHHPEANRRIRMQDGVIGLAENAHRRSYAFISGDFEEVIDARVDKYRRLDADQVLLVKDFILEDPAPPRGTSARGVDVPAPVQGYVSNVRASAGMVEISDRQSGEVLARVRHLSNLQVRIDQDVAYGQSLGTQNNIGLGLAPGVAVHVHLEIDSRLYREYANYMADLASGRLPVQAKYREDTEPLPAPHDGTFRLGESHPRIRDLQRVMHGEGYRGPGGVPLDRDGVYRPSMQGALLDFQRDHGVAQTGDVDPDTLRYAPRPQQRERDLADHFQPGRPLPAAAEPARAPGHPDHADHRGALPAEPAPPVNRRAGNARSAAIVDTLFAAMHDGDNAFKRALDSLADSPDMQAMLQHGLARLELDDQQQQAPAQLEERAVARG